MTLATLSPAQLHRTVASMERHGGGFCRALAQAWYAADRGNRARLESAFAHVLSGYAPGSGFYEEGQ